MWKKRYAEAFPLASLDRTKSGNYVIQCVDLDGSERDRKVITVQEGNRLGIDVWRNDFVTEKMFKIEPCSDDAGDCVITSYASTDKQWMVDGATLKIKRYPNTAGGERLRPPLKNWRFTFEEVGSPGLKKYRIVSRDEDLEDDERVCLKIGKPNEKGVCQLEFGKKSDDDPTQLWCLHIK